MIYLTTIATIINGVLNILRLLKEHKDEQWAKDVTKLFKSLAELKDKESRSEAAKKINDFYTSI